jgi:ubiquinone/menaquinone biosynthesis C-methylase UbiE
MTDEEFFDDVEVKKANIRHHDVEARVFERAHPEGSSVYERAEVSRSLGFITRNSGSRDLCVDVGCGTGFVTGFELSLYKNVVSLDISKQMLRTVRDRYGRTGQLNLIVCDAEFLPLRSEIADLVSVSSVLHHLPKPFNAMRDMFRVLKKDGFLYATREPNIQRLRRFFDFFDEVIIQKVDHLLRQLYVLGPAGTQQRMTLDGLDYSKVDVHYQRGFHVATLSELLRSEDFEVISAYAYHWIYPDSNKGVFQLLLSRSNFIVEKIPFSSTLGRYISLIARKK